jgi:predicted metal-binding transcription factor (methanogenesis marker protein 9)
VRELCWMRDIVNNGGFGKILWTCIVELEICWLRDEVEHLAVSRRAFTNLRVFGTSVLFKSQ